MAQTIRLEVVTPEGLAVRADADQVDAPSVFGEFGVLPGHRPLLAALRAGVVRYRSAGKITALAVGPGFAEAGPDAMTVLTDVAIEGSRIDPTALRTRRDEIERAITTFAGEQTGAEFDALGRERDWLNAQIEAARESGRGA